MYLLNLVAIRRGQSERRGGGGPLRGAFTGLISGGETSREGYAWRARRPLVASVVPTYAIRSARWTFVRATTVFNKMVASLGVTV